MRKKHKPHHHLPDGAIYFVTASTYLKKPRFDSDAKKRMLRAVLGEKAAHFAAQIYAYVLMDSHYHLLIKIAEGRKLPGFIKSVNGYSALLLNGADGAEGRMVWYNYWDTCIKQEEGFWSRFNYIHHNPVKHGSVEKMEDYAFSSYRFWREAKGEEWLRGVWESYPVADYTKGDL